MAEELERIYTIPLRKVKASSRNGRADRAVRAVRAYLTKHMKAEEVWIDAAVNHALWAGGKFDSPSRLRVRARLFDDGVVEVSLPEEETTSGTSMREAMADAKEAKLEDAHKGALEAQEKAMAEGAATPSGLTKPTPKPQAEAGEDEEADSESAEEETPAPEAPKKPAAAKPAAPKPEPSKPAADAKKEAPAKSEAPKKAASKPAAEPKEPETKPKAESAAKKPKDEA